MRYNINMKIKWFIIPCILSIFMALVTIMIFQLVYDNTDACLDSGVCKEGLILNMQNGKQVIINKNTCSQYNGEWREKYKDCYFKN